MHGNSDISPSLMSSQSCITVSRLGKRPLRGSCWSQRCATRSCPATEARYARSSPPQSTVAPQWRYAPVWVRSMYRA